MCTQVKTPLSESKTALSRLDEVERHLLAKLSALEKVDVTPQGAILRLLTWMRVRKAPR